MSLTDLIVLYGLVGVACSVMIFIRSYERQPMARLGSAALAVALWPLWAPIALATPVARRPHSSPSMRSPDIEAALNEAVEAARGTPLEVLLPSDAARRILDEVQRVEGRCAELATLLERSDFDVDAARRRIDHLVEGGASPRILATARLQLENAERLQTMLMNDRRALLELSELINALRTQLVLARYAGSTVEGVGGIVSEVWSRVEGLGEAIEAQDFRSTEGVSA